jgi:hypothetical protein
MNYITQLAKRNTSGGWNIFDIGEALYRCRVTDVNRKVTKEWNGNLSELGASTPEDFVRILEDWNFKEANQ